MAIIVDKHLDIAATVVTYRQAQPSQQQSQLNSVIGRELFTIQIVCFNSGIV